MPLLLVLAAGTAKQIRQEHLQPCKHHQSSLRFSLARSLCYLSLCSMSSLYSRQQPGETWMGGILLAPGDTQTITESAAEASDYTQYLGKPRMHLCRQVAGGSLKVRAECS